MPCGVEHFGIDFVGADYEAVGGGYGGEEFLFRGVFFKELKLIAGILDYFAYAVDGYCCERLFGSYKYFHCFLVFLIG